MSAHQKMLQSSILERWAVSQMCDAATCLAVLHTGDEVLMRDTKNGSDPDQPIIVVGMKRYREFVEAVVTSGGPSDVSSDVLVRSKDLVVSVSGSNMVAVADLEAETQLSLTAREWFAYASGLAAGDEGLIFGSADRGSVDAIC